LFANLTKVAAITPYHAVADATPNFEFVVPWVETHGYSHATATRSNLTTEYDSIGSPGR
jgi:hypothetical protein